MRIFNILKNKTTKKFDVVESDTPNEVDREVLVSEFISTTKIINNDYAIGIKPVWCFANNPQARVIEVAFNVKQV